MKYGENFERESVPEWSLRTSPCIPSSCPSRGDSFTDSPPRQSTDNIDYNSLKHFIKVNTNKDEAKAIAIPGQQDTHLAKVENDLYHELCAQHGRAGLFVAAKADEINRRLRMRHPLFLRPSQPRRTWACSGHTSPDSRLTDLSLQSTCPTRSNASSHDVQIPIAGACRGSVSVNSPGSTARPSGAAMRCTIFGGLSTRRSWPSARS